MKCPECGNTMSYLAWLSDNTVDMYKCAPCDIVVSKGKKEREQ